MADKKVSIIGLGLIGGSLAKALREKVGIADVTAVSRSMEPLRQALQDGTIDRGFCEVNEYVWNSDIIFICTPVKTAIKYIETIAARVRPGCIVTDVGSTKAEITKYVDGLENAPCFIGGHPMAGTEKMGYASSFAHLFENAYYILSPCRTTNSAAMETMAEIVRGIGGIPVVMDPAVHDRVTAGISHVPHIIAAALVNMVRENDTSDGKMRMLAAGGFRDITRIASSSPEMWESIIASNRDCITQVLSGYIEDLNSFKRYIESNDSESVLGFFESAKNYRDLFSKDRKGLIVPIHEITVDVVDKPGIIGEIATILGNNNINIKNINISNSREFEQGCLKITLPDSASVDDAFKLLDERGYRVYKNR